MLEQLNDYDWKYAFQYAGAPEKDDSALGSPEVNPAPPTSTVSTEGFQRANVAELFAHVEGENDGPDWLCVGRLDDGRFFALRAGCDYTGWDCQAGGSASVAETREDIYIFGLDDRERERLGVKFEAVE